MLEKSEREINQIQMKFICLIVVIGKSNGIQLKHFV